MKNLLSLSMGIRRDSFERLCQEGQALNEGGRGDGSETRVSAQLQSQHQALLRRVSQRVHTCQLTLQEQQAFEETLQTTWNWLNGVQERLASLNSTIGNKETLEKRLGLVQVSKLCVFLTFLEKEYYILIHYFVLCRIFY